MNIKLPLLLVSFTVSFSSFAAGNPAGASEETWGGEHVQITVSGESARLDFDCAEGLVQSGWIPSRGRIDAEGTIIPGSGLPFAPGHGPVPEPARYSAEIRGDRMSLTVTSGSGKDHYVLTRGKEPVLYRCM